MEVTKKIHLQSKLPSIHSSTLPKTCQIKQKLPLLQNFRLKTGRHSTVPATRFKNDLDSPQPDLKFKHEDLKLASLTPRSKRRATFSKPNKVEFPSPFIEEKITNPQYCKAKDNQNLVRNNEKCPQSQNNHMPSRFIPINGQKKIKKPELYEEIKGLEKNLGGILEFKVNQIRDEVFLEKIYGYVPSKQHNSP